MSITNVGAVSANVNVIAFGYGAPDAATVGTNATQTPTSGSPQTGSAFPLKQSAIAFSANSLGPDRAANTGGATIAIVNWNATGSSDFRLTIPGLGIDETFSSATLFRGASTVTGNTFNLTVANLNYAALGVWAVNATSPTSVLHTGMFATGFETPGTAMPTMGIATYAGTGNVQGLLFDPGYNRGIPLKGDASFSANFATGAITGVFTNMLSDNQPNTKPWNDVSVNAAIAGGTSHFSGATTAASAPSVPYALSGSASGHIDGGFYGPHAEELGAVWSLGDASKSAAAIGVVGASVTAAGSSGAGGTVVTSTVGIGVQATGGPVTCLTCNTPTTVLPGKSLQAP